MQTAMAIVGRERAVCQHWQHTSVLNTLRSTTQHTSLKPNETQHRRMWGTTASSVKTTVPIIDSHIHLYPASEISTIPWLLKPGNPIGSQHSIEEYRVATASSNLNIKGFVFIEVSRRHDLVAGIQDGSGWEYPLMEVEWVKRIASGTPKEGEGHAPEHAELCLAIVPWAPLPNGKEVMMKYVGLVEERAGAAWGKVKGYRYLVLNKEKGVMIGDGFVESLRWMGTKGFAFDLGVNHHGNGDWQLVECLEMVRRAHEGVEDGEKVTFVIAHICKPDMTFFKTESVTDHPRFITWREAIGNLSKYSKTYMKLSVGFSEIPKEYKFAPAEEVFEAIQPWLLVVLNAFSPSRIMFGSDWPASNIGGSNNAWEKWRWIVQRLCQVANLSQEDEMMMWSGTAIKAYGIKELM